MQNGQNLKRRTKRVIAGAAAFAVMPALGLATAPTAAAGGDTPDNKRWQVAGGWVTWNDYDDDSHDDRDNLWVEDDWGDGKWVQLRVYWKGKTYKINATNGDEERLSFGNVPNGKKVSWRLYEYRGDASWKSKKYWVTE